MKSYIWILFDADGTLFDYSKAEAFALENAFGHIGIPLKKIHLKEYIRINRSIWDDLEKGLITAEELRTRRFDILFALFNIGSNTEKFSEIYLKYLSASRFLIDDAEIVISELAKKYKLAIITNGLMDVQKKRFSGSGIIQYFDHIIISEEIGFTKPDLEYFKKALNIIDFYDTEKILIVGDSLTSDIKGGCNAGIDTCWFNPNENLNLSDSKINFEINNLRELLNIL